MKDNAIQLTNEKDYMRAIEIEGEIMRETGWTLKPNPNLVTFPSSELVDKVRERLKKEGVKFS